MKDILRKLLGIQTWKIILVNKNYISLETAIPAFKNMPVKIIFCRNIENIKVIDTGIVAIRKKEENNNG